MSKIDDAVNAIQENGYVVRDGHIYKTKRSQTPITMTVKGEHDLTKEDLEEVYKKIRAVEAATPKSYGPDPEEMVRMALADLKIVLRDGCWFDDGRGSQPVKPEYIHEELQNWRNNFYFYNSVDNAIVGEKALTYAWEAHKKNIKSKEWIDLLHSVAYAPEAEAYRAIAFNQLLDAMGVPDTITDKITGDVITGFRPAAAAALAHWIWQVKRAMDNQAAEWELFLLFQGKDQGAGKSYLVWNLLCGVLGPWINKITLETIIDNRYNAYWCEFLVIFFDEIASKAGSTGVRLNTSEDVIDCLKELITAKTTSYRPMRTTEAVILPKRASFIGTSNKFLSHYFADETGMRRFFEIPCEKEIYDWDAMNAIDWKKVWMSVNEDLPTGYCHPNAPEYPKVKEIQKTYRRYTTIDGWLDAATYTLALAEAEAEAGTATPAADLFADYLIWCEDNGQHHRFQQNNFIDKLIAMKYRSVASGKKKDTFFKVNKDKK